MTNNSLLTLTVILVPSLILLGTQVFYRRKPSFPDLGFDSNVTAVATVMSSSLLAFQPASFLTAEDLAFMQLFVLIGLVILLGFNGSLYREQKFPWVTRLGVFSLITAYAWLFLMVFVLTGSGSISTT